MTLLSRLVAVSERVAASPGRLVKVRELADYLRSLPPGDLGTAVLYLSGATPQGRIGIGYAALRDAVSGGAATLSAPPGAEPLTLAEVDRTLRGIAALEGGGSAARRRQLLAALFSRAAAPEAAFLLALLSGGLRQGALAGVMQDALAEAAGLPADEIRRAAMYAPDLGALAEAALPGGRAALGRFQLAIFSPVAPMLAQTAADVGEALAMLGGEAAFEWKMDGARIQVHKSHDEVRIYTRGQNEVTSAIPEIVEAARRLPARSFILDGEAIVFGGAQAGGELAPAPAARRPRPFQVTMRRFGRRLDVERLRRELPIQAFFFDCLQTDGSVIAHLSAIERHAALEAAVPADQLMPRLVTRSAAKAADFYDSALAAGHEGLMAKSLTAPYEAGNRGAGWLKIKRAHTLDLVVLAAEWGSGRRTGKLSNLHLGALDTATGDYVMLGKTFKGLTDAMLEWQTRELLAREVRRDASTLYVRPELVVEIAFSDLQASIRYPAGLALRLARVKRYREDKRSAEADTLETVRRLYAASS